MAESDFISFARSFGIIIDHVPVFGKWVRLPTEDKPKHRNGAVKWMGDHAFVQNHATMQDVEVWQEETPSKSHRNDYSAEIERSKARIRDERKTASERALWILDQCHESTHAYLEGKGFPDKLMPVWERGESRLLVVPMYIDGIVSSVQLIAESGDKKFLSGGQAGGASYVMGQGLPIYCEGFATGLSIHRTIGNLRRSVVVTFSDSNLANLAKAGPIGSVCVADNDKSLAGETAAKKTGKPYWMSSELGEDFNDYWLRVGDIDAQYAIKELFSKQCDSLMTIHRAVTKNR